MNGWVDCDGDGDGGNASMRRWRCRWSHIQFRFRYAFHNSTQPLREAEKEEEEEYAYNASCRTFTKPFRTHWYTKEHSYSTRVRIYARTQLNFDQTEAKINTIKKYANKYYVRLLIQAANTICFGFSFLNQMRYVIDGRVLNNLHMVYVAWRFNASVCVCAVSNLPNKQLHFDTFVSFGT